MLKVHPQYGNFLDEINSKTKGESVSISNIKITNNGKYFYLKKQLMKKIPNYTIEEH